MTAEEAVEPKAPEPGRHQAWAWPCRTPARLTLHGSPWAASAQQRSPFMVTVWGQGERDPGEVQGGERREVERGGTGRKREGSQEG